jgi:hypothetical protein
MASIRVCALGSWWGPVWRMVANPAYAKAVKRARSTAGKAG